MSRVKFLLCFFLVITLIPKAKAAIATSYVDPDTVLAATTTIEFVKHAGGVWASTGAGVNFTFDLGQTWLLYDASNGMLSDNLSAIFSINNRLWVGASHSELVDESPTSFSDGLLYTDDLGDNWFQVDFSASGVDKLLGVNSQIFDIVGHYDANQNENWLFISAWAGALIASRDGGSGWRRIFPSIVDSINYTNNAVPDLRMLYFSCAVDTSHGDTLFLWGGTAEGIFEYIFVPADLKAFSPLINQIAFCDACTDSAGSFVFIGGNNGLTRGFKTGGPYVSRFQSDGLPGPQVSAVTDFRDRVIVGTATANGSSSTGLAYSDDRGDSFTPVAGFNSSYALPGNSNRIYDFAVIGERLYLAAEEAGLLVSLDSGLNWSAVVVDTPDVSQGNRRNVVYALNAEADTLRLGTDSGLVQLFMDPSGVVDSTRFYVFTEDDNSSARVSKVRTQRFFTDTTLDSTAIWTVNQRTTNGSPIVARSSDGGLSWNHLQIGQGVAELSHDINFTGDTVYIVGTEGAKRIASYSPGMLIQSFLIKDSVTSDAFDPGTDTLTTIEVHGDTIFIGTRNGFAIANARDSAVPPKFKITRINTDSLLANAVVQFQYDPANPFVAGVTGNFVPAIEVQYRGADPAIVWASCRPVGSGETNGIAAGAVVPVLLPDSSFIFERLWVSVYDDFAWNFAFNGDTVFAATNNGLIFTADTGFSWDTMQFIDSAGNVIYDASRPVFGVDVIDGNLWVGGKDRVLIVDLSSFVSQGFFVVDSATAAEEVYAFPVPYSNVINTDDGITFRFVVEQDAYVTIEVYDFAINLVRRVIDNRFFVSEFYPNLIASVRWDALNGQGHELAVGMYYFKVELSTGETRWGKLAIIP
ncbi:MAG: hypothetical protein IIA17_01990 [candidate division Zixibacteria bacterium]|nr:hypothetical protein [candidate division Zixibacteria bacterium]